MTKNIPVVFLSSLVIVSVGEASIVISPKDSVMTSGFFQGVDQVRGYDGDSRLILRVSSPEPFGLGQPEGIYFDFISFDPTSFRNPVSSAAFSVTSVSGGFNADADLENPFLVSAHGLSANPLLAIADDTNPDGMMSAVEFESTHILNVVSSVSVDSFGLVTFDVTDLIDQKNSNYFIALTGREDGSGSDFLHGFSNNSEVPGATFLRVVQIPEPSALFLLTIGSLALLWHRRRGMKLFHPDSVSL
ncbi:PEP-CTERM sorting domain-containing protein [Akkermansiaceae bacterium]|nr:PEP-CTERM sorting domain-containing protein [Akkermansiaceae bacterium]